MKIKRFEAKNMTSALRMIKDELGPDAVILSARSLRKGKGFFGSMKYAGVEVSAAIDEQQYPMHRTDFRSEKEGVRDSVNRGNSRSYPSEKNDRITSPGYRGVRRTYRQPYDYKKQNTLGYGNRAYSSLYRKLLDQNVDRSIASELIEEFRRIPASKGVLGNEELKSYLVSFLEEMGIVADKSALSGDKPKIAAFIGTTGVGKTTAVAKLAALQAKRCGKRVALITIDSYGISANEQLKAYARIIGIPVEVAFNPAELKQALKNFKDKDLILIDTPGINPKNPDEIQNLKFYIDNVADLQIHLVLSAATKGRDLIAIADAFKAFGVNRLLFTKVDESSVLGELVNVLIRTNIQLSFLSCGRKVPDDIEAGSIEKMVDLLFESEPAARRQTSTSPEPRPSKLRSAEYQSGGRPPRFVANKNSDVYHIPDCKWSKKIKPGNLIKFADSQEAEARNFLPCRSCNPDSLQSSEPIDLKTDKRRISNYS
jgi:flagellar biosynthesis protein FlhF